QTKNQKCEAMNSSRSVQCCSKLPVQPRSSPWMIAATAMPSKLRSVLVIVLSGAYLVPATTWCRCVPDWHPQRERRMQQSVKSCAADFIPADSSNLSRSKADRQLVALTCRIQLVALTCRTKVLGLGKKPAVLLHAQ